MTTLHVTFRVGSADYAIPASSVLHLEAFDSATPVPGAPVFVAGLVHVRGRVVPVVDLRTRFGLPAIAHELGRRVIIVQVGTRVAGLAVDSAREVIALAADAFSEPPELIDRQANGFVSAVAAAGKRLFLIVDVARVIGEEIAS